MQLPDWFQNFDKVHSLNMAVSLVNARLNEIGMYPEPWPGADRFDQQVWEAVKVHLLAMVRELTSNG